MKKLFSLLMLTFTISIASYGQEVKDKVKKTSTVPQKVHNTYSKNKHHKGYKSKHKRKGRTQKHKVDLRKDEVKNKTEK